AATCNGKGIKTYTCTGCNATRTEEIPSTGHQHTELRNVKAATCAQEGYTGDAYCKDCNTKLTAGKVLPKTDHTWDSGKITTVATCSGKGIKTYTCTGCNATRTEEIMSTGHQHTELRNATVATCAQEGYTGDTYCKDCNTKLTSGNVIPKTDHIWDSGKVTQNATCTAKGIKTFTCTVCKSTRIEEIPATGHVNKITKFAKEASCKSEGYTGDIYCQDCGKLLEEGQVIPKADHVWNKGEITTPATCTTKGIKTYSCASCGTTKTEAIAATGHGATEIRNKKDATTTSEGYTGDIYCTICNQKISSGKKIAKLTPQTATPGKTIKDKSTNGFYKVLQDGVSVEFTKPVYKKASVRIPDTIKVNGITCKVTGISANAFKNNKSLKSVTIGRNVTVIGTNAFYGCKKLSKVSGGNRIVKIGHRAFANCNSLSKITIPGSVRSIGKQAFCNCKKLRSIIINTSTLSGKTVGSKAFAGTYKKPTVKVPAKQMKTYKKLLKARGMSSKAVYRK
ncbi:MAG: leucine-rich repeat domain-containing protein, partial [Lachnospiraceae bacterium]